MSWMIGRTAALSNPEAARRKALEKLRGLAELDDPESMVVPILIDAILIAARATRSISCPSSWKASTRCYAN